MSWVIVGLAAATISSALGSILVAPRTLQADEAVAIAEESWDRELLSLALGKVLTTSFSIGSGGSGGSSTGSTGWSR